MKDYTPATFTKERPCNKTHLHNAFFDGKKYVDRLLVHAQAVIGKNCPRYLIRKGFVVQRLIGSVDWYCLTPAGKQWLQAGISRHLALHPADINLCTHLPPGFIRQGGKAHKTGPSPIIRRRRSG